MSIHQSGNNFHFSCHLFPWGEDYERGLKDLALSNISSVEIGSKHLLKYEHRIMDWKKKLDHARLHVSAIFEFGHFANWEKRREIYLHHDRLSKLLSKVDVDTVILGPGMRFPAKGTDRSANMIKMINEINKRYRNYGIKMGIHPHYAQCIFSESEIDTIFQQISEDIYLVPDIEHLVRANIDIIPFLQKYMDKIMAIHLKDIQFADPAQTNFSNTTKFIKPCILGTGDLNLLEIFDVLIENQYSNWLTLEMGAGDPNPDASLNSCIAYLKKNKLMLNPLLS